MNLEEKSIIFWEKSEGEKSKTNFNELFFLKKLDVMNDQRGKWRKIEKHLRSHHLNFPSVENSIIIELNMDERGRGSKCSDESPWRCSICLISMSSSSFRYERLWFVSMSNTAKTNPLEREMTWVLFFLGYRFSNPRVIWKSCASRRARAR